MRERKIPPEPQGQNRFIEEITNIREIINIHRVNERKWTDS